MGSKVCLEHRLWAALCGQDHDRVNSVCSTRDSAVAKISRMTCSRYLSLTLVSCSMNDKQHPH